jgi:Domain of unknown function (DUF4340)
VGHQHLLEAEIVMRPRNLLVAAIVLAALSAGVWWAKKHPQTPETKAAADTTVKLVNLPDDQLSQLEIKKKDGTVLLLLKQNGKWTIGGTEPYAADQDATSGVAGALAPLTADSSLDEKQPNLAGFGLVTPALIVTATKKNGKTETILFGDDVPAGSQVYVQHAGDPKVYLAPIAAKASFEKSTNDLRDKRLLTFDSDKVTRIELAAQKGQLEFGKNNQNEWQILKPKPYRADSFTVEDLLRKLHDAKMDLSASADDAKKADAAYAAGQPVATAKITDAASTQTLDVRKNKDDYYAKSSVVKGAFKVNADLGTGVDKSLDAFRSKKIFDFGFSDPTKLQIRNGPAETTYQKTGSDWKSNGKSMDSGGVQSVIDKLRDLAAVKFVETGFTAGALEIDVTSNDGKRVEKVSFAKVPDGYLARRENEPALYQLDSKAVDDILKGIGEIKPAASVKK